MLMLEFIALHFSSLLLLHSQHWPSIPFSIQKSAIGETQGQIAEIENSLARAFTYSLFLAIPTCIGGWILGEKLLYYLYGASFVEGTPALFFLLLVQIVNVFMYLGTMSLTALNRPKDAFWITVIAAIANILLDLTLIPVMGITGAAVATLIAMTIQCTWCPYSPFPGHFSKIRI